MAVTTPVKGKKFTLKEAELAGGQSKTHTFNDNGIGNVWAFTVQPNKLPDDALISPEEATEDIEITRVVFWADRHASKRGYRITIKNGGSISCTYILTGVVFVPA